MRTQCAQESRGEKSSCHHVERLACTPSIPTNLSESREIGLFGSVFQNLCAKLLDQFSLSYNSGNTRNSKNENGTVSSNCCCRIVSASHCQYPAPSPCLPAGCSPCGSQIDSWGSCLIDPAGPLATTYPTSHPARCPPHAPPLWPSSRICGAPVRRHCSF